jgi:hypothetical protein
VWHLGRCALIPVRVVARRLHIPLQGYLAYEKHPLLGTYGRLMPRVLRWSWGGWVDTYVQGNPESRNGRQRELSILPVRAEAGGQDFISKHFRFVT